MLTKQSMIQQLEDYWLETAENNPTEEMDIPGAVMYYNQLTFEEVLLEYNNRILQVDKW